MKEDNHGRPNPQHDPFRGQDLGSIETKNVIRVLTRVGFLTAIVNGPTVVTPSGFGS